LNVVQIIIAGPPADHVKRRSYTRTLTRAAGVVNLLYFALAKNAIENFDLVDAPGEGVINSVTEDSYLGGKRVICGSAAVVTTKDKGRLTRSVKVKLEPFGAAGGSVTAAPRGVGRPAPAGSPSRDWAEGEDWVVQAGRAGEASGVIVEPIGGENGAKAGGACVVAFRDNSPMPTAAATPPSITRWAGPEATAAVANASTSTRTRRTC